MPAQDWVPPGVDTSIPSSARIYDYLLGGNHNFAVDRATAEQLAQVEPHAGAIVRINRAFVARVVRYLVGQGIRQFLDIGAGIPTVGNVHEIAQRIDPSCRVVYVDRDRVAVAHSELLLASTPGTGVVHADARDPDAIFASAPVRQLLDLDEPIGLLFMLVLHWVPDEPSVDSLLRRYRERLAPGSHLALSHIVYDKHQQYMDEMVSVMQESRSADQLTPRRYEEIAALFGDFELVEPGLVGCAEWRPAGPGDIVDIPLLNEYVHGGLARKA